MFRFILIAHRVEKRKFLFYKLIYCLRLDGWGKDARLRGSKSPIILQIKIVSWVLICSVYGVSASVCLHLPLSACLVRKTFDFLPDVTEAPLLLYVNPLHFSRLSRMYSNRCEIGSTCGLPTLLVLPTRMFDNNSDKHVKINQKPTHSS